MDSEINLGGLDVGHAALDQMFAEQAAANGTPNPASATPEQRAALPPDDVQTQLDNFDGIPAGAETAKPAADAQPSKAVDTTKTAPETKPAAVEDKGSRFAKDAQRRDTSWKALNAEKESTAKERAALASERAAWQAERDAATAAEDVTPDKFQSYAQKQRVKADHLTAEAERLEKAGKYTEAEGLKEEARDCEAEIRKANRAAEDLKRNPNPTAAQKAEARAAQEKEWTLKAATDFPDLAKTDSAFAKTMAEYKAELAASAPLMARDPKSIYFVARLVEAETASARMPAMEKELGKMKARVKELEALTNPGEAGQPMRPAGDIPFSQQSQADQWAALEAQARETSLR